MKRTPEMHSALIERLACVYGLLANQGLESHLFVVGNRVLKIYQWFLMADLDLEEEFKLRKQQRWLLSIYAPRLDARLIAVSADGSIFAASAETFCYGLLISRGNPFFESVWEPASGPERIDWATWIGTTLAARHVDAPLQTTKFHEDRTILKAWIKEVLDRITAYEIGLELLPQAWQCILKAVDSLLQSGDIWTPATVPVVHGDLNLSNIVLAANNEPQFIDPGPALLLGIGLRKPNEWTLDSWWDAALLSKHFLEHGGAQVRDAFLRGYSDRLGVSHAFTLSRLRYWQALCYLMIVAVCCKRWHDFQEESNPFAKFLRVRGISLSTYTQYFFAQGLRLLQVTDCFPAFMAQFGREIFTP